MYGSGGAGAGGIFFEMRLFRLAQIRAQQRTITRQFAGTTGWLSSELLGQLVLLPNQRAVHFLARRRALRFVLLPYILIAALVFAAAHVQVLEQYDRWLEMKDQPGVRVAPDRLHSSRWALEPKLANEQPAGNRTVVNRKLVVRTTRSSVALRLGRPGPDLDLHLVVFALTVPLVVMPLVVLTTLLAQPRWSFDHLLVITARQAPAACIFAGGLAVLLLLEVGAQGMLVPYLIAPYGAGMIVAVVTMLQDAAQLRAAARAVRVPVRGFAALPR